MQKLLVADLTVARHATSVLHSTLPKSATNGDCIAMAMLQQLCR